MPTYTHRCDQCGAAVDLVCPMADRDKPKACSELQVAIKNCNKQGELKRPEGELELTALTPYSWKP